MIGKRAEFLADELDALVLAQQRPDLGSLWGYLLRSCVEVGGGLGD